MNNVEDRIIDIVAEQFRLKRSEIKLTTKFTDDLGADSLDIVDLIMTIEEEFKLDVPDETADTLDSVGDVIEYIKAHQKN